MTSEIWSGRMSTLTHLVNRCLICEGEGFPDGYVLKISNRVVPVYKKGSRDLPSINYRPAYLMPILSKVLDAVIV